MNEPKRAPATDSEVDRDPEEPQLTDLEQPEADPGTDIVPPETHEPRERREGVVSDPDADPHPTAP